MDTSENTVIETQETSDGTVKGDVKALAKRLGSTQASVTEALCAWALSHAEFDPESLDVVAEKPRGRRADPNTIVRRLEKLAAQAGSVSPELREQILARVDACFAAR